MSVVDSVLSVVDRVADIAGGVKRKLSYFVFIGVAASAFLGWSVYSQESALWWNLAKCGALALPALVWIFVWSVLAQLQEAPVLVASLIEDDDGLFSNVQNLSLSEPNGLSGVFSTIREFRQEDGLSVVFETLSGVSLLANPLFAIFAFVNWAILFTLIIIALLLLIF